MSMVCWCVFLRHALSPQCTAWEFQLITCSCCGMQHVEIAGKSTAASACSMQNSETGTLPTAVGSTLLDFHEFLNNELLADLVNFLTRLHDSHGRHDAVREVGLEHTHDRHNSAALNRASEKSSGFSFLLAVAETNGPRPRLALVRSWMHDNEVGAVRCSVIGTASACGAGFARQERTLRIGALSSDSRAWRVRRVATWRGEGTLLSPLIPMSPPP